MHQRPSAIIEGPVGRRSLPDPSVEREATFGWSSRSPARARRFVADSLQTWGCADRINDAALIASELATNAVLHARTKFTVVVSRHPGGTIRVAVRDASMARPRPRPAGPLAGSGRGLPLVEALASGWGADVVPEGKVVWAEIPAGSRLTLN